MGRWAKKIAGGSDAGGDRLSFLRPGAANGASSVAGDAGASTSQLIGRTGDPTGPDLEMRIVGVPMAGGGMVMADIGSQPDCKIKDCGSLRVKLKLGCRWSRWRFTLE